MAAYLSAPMEFHSQRNSAVAARTAVQSINLVFTIGLVALSMMVTELSALVLMATLLVVVSPLAAVAAVIYFSLAIVLFNRVFQRQTQSQASEWERLTADSLVQFQESLGVFAKCVSAMTSRIRCSSFGEFVFASNSLTAQ